MSEHAASIKNFWKESASYVKLGQPARNVLHGFQWKTAIKTVKERCYIKNMVRFGLSILGYPYMDYLFAYIHKNKKKMKLSSLCPLKEMTVVVSA